ncbi:hypothetical protein GGD41_007260 [Paraburkholderia bryophila]|uniref:Uncharacterized protein n=1 Tax=Paraburkholderia bryophila TaxID=420952 RepID=A0A7Z0B548_9BURK|nr:hypothetical protein [Paraburkholderia bryophila]
MSVPDLVGSADEIIARLLEDPVLCQVSELRLELPYDLPFENYQQILEDVVTRVALELGWRPADAQGSQLTTPAELPVRYAQARR